MGSHPVNLGIRFLLEMSSLVWIGMWGWRLSENWPRYGLAFGIPIILVLIWGTFAVPDDPSRSGNAPIPVPGFIRLIIELAIFSFATFSLFNLGMIWVGIVFGILFVVHYLLSYDRVRWLLKGCKVARLKG